MNKEYIEKKAFAVEMQERQEKAKEWLKGASCQEMRVRADAVMRCLAEIKLTLDKLPAVDAKPVERREWEDCAVELDSSSNRHDYRCPKCGYPADYFICGTEDWWCASEPNFCPHCGADMRKEQG